MRILVIGGMHGNEPLGQEVVKLFQSQPLANIDTILANEQAIAGNSRFIKQDLNRSFPGNRTSKEYEPKRAAQLLELAKKYDVVLDFHNTHCPKNDCTFVGSSAEALLFDISSWFGLKRVIVADYDCINKFATNCISIEISLSSPRMNAQWWYGRISKLSNLVSLPRAEDIEKFKFVYRMTLDDKAAYNLSPESLKAFEPISVDLAKKLDVDTPAYPIFINDKYTPYNYGGLLNKITV